MAIAGGADAPRVADGTSAPASMYAMPMDRAKEHGFVSFYNHTGDPATDRLANNLTLTSEELAWLLVNPFSLQLHLGGWGGLGFDAEALPQLLPCVLWVVVFTALRLMFRRRISWLGMYLRVVVPKGSDAKAASLTRWQRNRLKKFQAQVWLAATYTLSTAFGYVVQRDKPWFGLPLGEANRISILTPHPYKPGPELVLYYQYGLGFYLAELLSLFMEHDLRRSDFLEYLLHHIVTILLIVVSHCAYEHRFGAYVLFIHDASDIMLCVSKSLSYVVRAAEVQEKRATKRGARRTESTEAPSSCLLYRIVFSGPTVLISFALFILGFVFFRLVCLPWVALASAGLAVKIRKFTVFYWILVILLQVALQGLHVYWFILIIKIVIRTLFGGPLTDIRSDDEEEEENNVGSNGNARTARSVSLHTMEKGGASHRKEE